MNYYLRLNFNNTKDIISEVLSESVRVIASAFSSKTDVFSNLEVQKFYIFAKVRKDLKILALAKRFTSQSL